MSVEYYREYFKRYADSSEEDAIKVQTGAVEMDILECMGTETVDKVAHQASIVLNMNNYKSDKDAYINDICYEVCTADCDINEVIGRCKKMSSIESYEVDEDVSTICRILTLADKQSVLEPLGYVSEEMQRAYLIHDKPEYAELSSNIDYILYDLLDVLDLNTDKGKEYVYRRREQFIRPIMDLVLRSGDIGLMEQMRQVYRNWMEWR